LEPTHEELVVVTLRRQSRALLVAAACAALLSACSEKDSYAAAESALADWLAAVEDGSTSACGLETQELSAELLADHPELGGPGTSCEERVRQMVGLGLPDSASEMTVPAWDPSGAAIVEVTTSGSKDVSTFAMTYQDGRWLVASVI
jgi:hypothetical protein